MKKLSFLLATVFLLFSCKHEIEKPTWDVDMITPIAYANLNIDNIIPDSDTIISIDDEGVISLVYQQPLLDVNYDSLLILETTSEETTIRIDSVDFDDVVIEHNITIGSVINEIPFGTVLFPNNSQRDIPAMPGVIQDDTINIDASEYFETMTLYNGILSLEVINNFPTAISNISIGLYNAQNQNLISTFSTPLLASGASYTESVSVAGETLDHLMIGIINNMDVNASNGLVPINYSDAIITKISITDIKIMEATAYFPNQKLHEENVEESFELGSARLTELGIKEGTVIINAISTLPDTGTIVYSIPSLTKNGEIFKTSVKIPPTNNNEFTQFTFNFDGYIMDLTGKEGRIGGDTVNTIYATLAAYLDSTGELETIHQVDSFYLFNEYFFTPEYAKGYIGQDTFEFGPEIIETDIFDFVQSGNINLESAQISIAVDNYIGADAAFQINNLSTLNNEDEVSAQISNSIHSINRATLTGNNSIVHSSTNIDIEASNLLEIFPDKINTSATFYLNPNGQTANEDFIYPDHPMEANLDVTIPLKFIANELTLSNTTELKAENIEEVDILYVTIENGLPLEAKIDLITIDENNQVIDTIMNKQQILSALTNNNGDVIENAISTLEIKNSNFSNIERIKAIASFNTKPQQEFLSIYNSYNISIALSAKLQKTIGK